MSKVIINDKEYVIADLPQEAQTLINFYSIWDREETEAKASIDKQNIEILKVQAAKMHVIRELEAMLTDK